MKIGVISLGCAKNLIDTENLLGLLVDNDMELEKDINKAEVIIINTCGFIEPAKEEAIKTILDAAELKGSSLKKLIVMGCLAERYKEDLVKEMPEVDRFIAINEYDNLGNILSEVLNVKISNNYGKAKRLLSGKPWMAYLRIADGCDNKCSYCAIPLIRGPLKSRDENEIIEEAKELVKSGVKEINLVAQDSSRYGYDLDGQLHLSSLLKKLDEIEGIEWIRILYLYPDENRLYHQNRLVHDPSLPEKMDSDNCRGWRCSIRKITGLNIRNSGWNTEKQKTGTFSGLKGRIT